MNDLTTLHDAFAELERRADLLPERVAAGPPPRSRRPLLVAASVVAVLAVATGVALVTGRGSVGHHDLPAGGAPSPNVSASAPPVTGPAPNATSSGARSRSIALGPQSTLPPTMTTPARDSRAPRTAAALVARLRTILGSHVTFTWTAVAGAKTPYIGGVLTDHATGRQGGFDLQVVQGAPGDKAECEDPGTSHCTVRRLADGSSLSVGREQSGGGMLYLVNLVRPDGLALLMHVSTNSDPKGGGQQLSSKPPLSTAQITSALRSRRW